jgi:hypothetical protein
MDTTYFHVVANQRKRKTTIHAVEPPPPPGDVDTIEEIVEVAT